MTAQRKKPMLMSPPSVADLRAQLVKRGMVAPMLSVVVPVKNEEDAILPFVKRVIWLRLIGRCCPRSGLIDRQTVWTG